MYLAEHVMFCVLLDEPLGRPLACGVLHQS
jgi:hypothetical protein